MTLTIELPGQSYFLRATSSQELATGLADMMHDYYGGIPNIPDEAHALVFKLLDEYEKLEKRNQIVRLSNKLKTSGEKNDEL